MATLFWVKSDLEPSFTTLPSRMQFHKLLTYEISQEL